MARRLRQAAGGGDPSLPTHDSMLRMVHRWEREGLDASRSERYELLYAKAFGISPEELPCLQGQPGGGGGGPTVLRGLLHERRWGMFEAFEAQFARAARELAEREWDPRLAKVTVSKRQFERWRSGTVKSMPRQDSSRVLEYMFGVPVRQLLSPADTGVGEEPEDDSPASPMPGLPVRLDEASKSVSGTADYASGVASLSSSLAADMVEAVKRREFLLSMATTVAFGAVGGIAQAFKHVDPELIPYFRQQLEGHYSADMLLGPRALISTVTAQCNLIGQLVDSADEPTRQRMAVVGTSFATFAAWLYLDAGDMAAALYWHDAAQEMAHRSRDREAIACALVDRAMARTDQGAGAAVVDLCGGALMNAGHLSPELRVFALQQQAHGASLLGDRRQVDTLLDEAGQLVDQVDVEVWGTACLRTPHYVEVQRATCYGRLGLASEAFGVWQQIIPAAPSSARRDVGVWMARQATLSASLREPERTVEFTRHAVKVALETGSVRVRRELEATEVTMTPWQAEPVGRDFAEVLAPISEGV
jgi:hypothetical protein